jgi:hypothetical protein
VRRFCEKTTEGLLAENPLEGIWVVLSGVATEVHNQELGARRHNFARGQIRDFSGFLNRLIAEFA